MIQSDSQMPQENERICGKVLKYVYTAFLSIWAMHFGNNIEDRVKLLESIVLNCCFKVRTAELHKRS